MKIDQMWRSFLSALGIGPCCDDMRLKEIVFSPYYYEYECESCKKVRRGPIRFHF